MSASAMQSSSMTRMRRGPGVSEAAARRLRVMPGIIGDDSRN